MAVCFAALVLYAKTMYNIYVLVEQFAARTSPFVRKRNPLLHTQCKRGFLYDPFRIVVVAHVGNLVYILVYIFSLGRPKKLRIPKLFTEIKNSANP